MDAVLLNHLLMASYLDDTSAGRHKDSTCRAERFQSASDDQQRFALAKLGDSLLNVDFVARIRTGGGFV